MPRLPSPIEMEIFPAPFRRSHLSDVDLPGSSSTWRTFPLGRRIYQPNDRIHRSPTEPTWGRSSISRPHAVCDGVTMTATVIDDNTTTTAFFNFTDEFLEGETATDMTDRLRVIQPPAAVDVYYSPSIDRVVLTGVDGYASGHYISLAADSESYYGDTSPIQVANGNGQRCICAREYLGTLYSLKERSGFVISPTATDPSTWSVQQRWEGVGPCGPRAVCVTNDFMLFVHRSGVYAYTASSPQPELLTKEIPTLLVDHQLGRGRDRLVLRRRGAQGDSHRAAGRKRHGAESFA